MDSCRLEDVERATAECGPVLSLIFAGGRALSHTDAQFLQAHCVATGLVQLTNSLRRASTVTHDQRAEIDHPLLIDYYKTNIKY